MKFEGFEFKIDLLSKDIIEWEICNHYNLGTPQSGGFGFNEKIEIGKPYYKIFSGKYQSVSAHFIILPDNDGKYEVKVSGVDADKRHDK